MGRHSTPDDDEDDVSAGGLDLLSLGDGPVTGRHLRIDDDLLPDDPPDVASVDVVVDDAPDVEAVAEAGAPRPDPGPHRDTLLHRGAHASAADVALLRSNGALRTRCVAAFLAPFVVYVVVLIVIGASGRDYLVWIWAPTILACVVVGSLLDVAHRDVAVAPDVPVASPAELTGPIEAIRGLDVSPAELTGPLPIVEADPADAPTDDPPVPPS